MAELAPIIDSMVRSRVYDSPQTPSARPSSATTPSAETPYFSISRQRERPNRKRSRNDSWELATPYSTTVSPAPFANMKYRLAGAQDSSIDQNDPHNSMTPDTAFRRGRPYSFGRTDYFHEHCGDNLAMPGRTDNEHGNNQISQPTQPTWGSLVLGLAGKVFEFCTAGGFRGFFAGGGRGYALDQSKPSTEHHTGSYQESGENNWTDIPTSSTTELEDEYSQTAKKSKITHDGTWVIVRPPSGPVSPMTKTRPPSLIPRLSSSASLVNISSPSKVSLASTATIGHSQSPIRPTSNLHRTLSTRTASSAGLRSSEPISKSHQRTGSIHSPNKSIKPLSIEPHQRRKSYITPSTSPIRSTHKSTLSTSTPTSHEGVQSYEQAESPLAKETRRHLDKFRRQELAEDREIMKMNNQLKDLIKQGQQALGTKVEVEFAESDDW